MEETGRNFDVDIEKFHQDINRIFKVHNNSNKLVVKKLKQIEEEQSNLQKDLKQMEERVQSMETLFG